MTVKHVKVYLNFLCLYLLTYVLQYYLCAYKYIIHKYLFFQLLYCILGHYVVLKKKFTMQY